MDESLVEDDPTTVADEDGCRELGPSLTVVTMVVADDDSSLLCVRHGSEDVSTKSLGGLDDSELLIE